MLKDRIIFEGKEIVRKNTESMFDIEGAKGINQNYMLGRLVYNPNTKGSSWGEVIGCYEKNDGVIAFRVLTKDGNKVLWRVKSCKIAPEGFYMED